MRDNGRAYFTGEQSKQALAHPGRRGQDAVMAQANREIARSAGHETQSIQPLTETGKLFTVHHFSGPLGSSGAQGHVKSCGEATLLQSRWVHR